MNNRIMRINVHYYAEMREQRGRDEDSLDIEAPSLSALYQHLQASFGFRLAPQHVRPAVNDEFCDWDRRLEDGDCVVFIPPVAGG